MWPIFQAIKRSWSQHFVEQFSAFIVMTMTYAALLFVALSLTNIQSLFDSWGKVNRASIYWKVGTTKEKKLEIIEALSSSDLVDSFEVVTSSQSANHFGQKFSKVSSEKLDPKKIEKYFPEYHIINLNHQKAYKSGLGVLENFVDVSLSHFPEIKNISYGKNWIDRYVGILVSLKTLGWFLIVSFLIASMIVSASVVKTILFSRRDEIEILEFIGANDNQIYLPQIFNSLFLSVIAFLCGLGANAIGFYQLKNQSVGLFSRGTLAELNFVPVSFTIGLFALCVFSVVLYSSYSIFALLPRRKKSLLLGRFF